MDSRIGYRGPGMMGHNDGPPLDAGASWRRFAWKKARAELLGPRLPVEVIRRRVVRARELGLAYPDYAAILLGSGRDITAFLFTCEAIGLRLARRLDLPEPSRARLASLIRCERAILAPEGEAPGDFAAELQEVSGLTFVAGAAPAPAASWGESRAALLDLLGSAGLPANAVVMVGTRPLESRWAEAAALARFLPAEKWQGAAAV
ncbi:hypothetical protein HMH01_08495 [Halovulum dunhuangense]|uniref:Uncharacterized protein n=1 Tax=Halovulum dunhuangense TaxID=1505036 RepID=A0A849L2B5_9RHOB|nr:hypothetical protein [Halovulum dunhuangense]NNU80478.1 hypothetical protein [Halovulum dunhuangense]